YHFAVGTLESAVTRADLELHPSPCDRIRTIADPNLQGSIQRNAAAPRICGIRHTFLAVASDIREVGQSRHRREEVSAVPDLRVDDFPFSAELDVDDR